MYSRFKPSKNKVLFITWENPKNGNKIKNKIVFFISFFCKSKKLKYYNDKLILNQLIYFLSNLGSRIKSKIIANTAAKIVIYPSWLIDLNSENNNGIKDAIIMKVVLITALNVFLSQYINASSGVKPLLLLKLYDEIIWIESSTINPKTIAKINAFDKLK